MPTPDLRKKRQLWQQQNDHTPGEERETPESTEEIRRTLLAEIKRTVENKQSTDQAASSYDRLKLCIFDAKDRHPTLLHWIVVQVESQQKNADDADNFMQAAEILVKIAMRFNEKLIKEVDQGGNTSLHNALNSTDDRVESLISAMCSYDGSQKHLLEAISHRNNSGKNCLHLAIHHRSPDIAEEIISIADEAAFRQGRNFGDYNIGQAQSDSGNTPLHDAVNYARSLIERPECTKPTTDDHPCKACQTAIEEYRINVSNVTALITKLIERCNQALTIKNDNDESPYLYFMRTKLDYELREKDERSVSKSQKSTGCPMRWSNEASVRVESLLIESAFTIGGFKAACACFFGNRTDEYGKSSPLRPGYPILESSSNKYKFLIPLGTAVLSHVDLQVDRSGSRTDKPAPSTAPYGESSSTSTQQETESSNEDNEDQSIQQWRRDMKALRNIFKMLRGRGVKRILKVTVTDNAKRPCSDQVFQECLAGFDVRYLNWTKPDLSASVICTSCPKVAELTLYSSGRRAVLDSWAANTGLCTLRQLTHVNLHAALGLEEYSAYTDLMRHFSTELTQNIDFARRKSVLVSKLEMCKLDIQLIEGYIQDLDPFKDATYLEDCKQEIKKEQQKKEVYQQGLSSLGIEKETCECQRMNRPLVTWHFGGNKSATADAILQDHEKEGSSPASNKACIPSNVQGSDAESINFEVVKGMSSKNPGHANVMSQNWHYNNPYDGPPNKESKLFKTTLPGGDYNTGDFVSLDFVIDILLEKSPSSDEEDAWTIPNGDGTVVQISTALEENRWLKAVERFVTKRVRPIATEPQGRIKVALIDDGIDYRQIDHPVHHPGWPIAKPDSEEKPWYHSENGHGTIMAKMIFRMCPHAQLFVAKLGGYHDLKKSDNAGKAAGAIAWAIKHEVNVISMSWSLVSSSSNKDGIAELKTQIEEAAKAKILIYCAAADKGPFAEKGTIFPHSRSTPGVRIIGSAKEAGGESQFIDPTQVHYLFPGENIPDLGDTKGSSVATALAAGFAALILWCFKHKNESNDTVERISNLNGMDNIFNKLTQHPSKWVNVTTLLGVDNPASIESVIQLCKSSVDWKFSGV
ncbi:hypothetical protein V8C44DRAFT_341207 [Trichoderma aethiopicum]